VQKWNKPPSFGRRSALVGQAGVGQPLQADARQVVRGVRYRGKSRILRRLALGVVASLEVEDASPTSAALHTLQRWVERVAEAEVRRLTQRCAHYEEKLGFVPRWVERGMGARWQRLGALEQRVQMLLGIFAAVGVLSLEFKPAHSVCDLLVQYLEELEREAEQKGGVQQLLAAHFAQAYKVGCVLHSPFQARTGIRTGMRP
jgi:hypothetical protein